jgi:hypothetical protein
MSNFKKKKTDEVLSDLHAQLAVHLTHGLVHGMEVMDDSGEIKRVPVNPAYLNVVRQFLKDNKMEALPAQGSPMGNLVEALPSFEELDQ